MRFRSAIIWNGISLLGSSGVTLLSTIILARLLTPDDFGIVGIVTIFIALSQMMVDSEMGGALLRKREVTRIDYSTLFYYNLVVSLIIYGLLYFSAPLIADFYNRPPLVAIIRVISLTIIIHAFRVVQRIIIFRKLDFKINAIINVVSGLISLCVAVRLAYIGYGYWAIVWQQICSAACMVILMSVNNRFIPVLSISKESFKYQFNFGISLLGSDIIKTIANNISTNIIAKITTLQFTGYYTQTSRLTNFCQSTFGSLMDQSIFPMLAKYNEVSQVRFVYNKILRVITFILLLITVLLITFAYQIIDIVLGKEWVIATPIFRVLSLGILPASIQILCRNIMKTLGTTRIVFYIETTKSIIVISFLLLASFFGAMAIVWGLIIAQIICCIIWLYFTNNQFQKSFTNLININDR